MYVGEKKQRHQELQIYVFFVIILQKMALNGTFACYPMQIWTYNQF